MSVVDFLNNPTHFTSIDQPHQHQLGPNLKMTLAIMFRLVPFYLFACSVGAVKFYGHAPSAYTHT